MDHDGFTRWDRLPVAYPGLHEGVRGRDAADCLLRAVARIERYELAARALRDRGPHDPAINRLVAPLGRDYHARCRAWARPKSLRETPSAGLSFLVVACGLVGPLSVWAVVQADPQLALLRGWPVILMTGPVLLPLAVLAASAAARLASPRISLEEAVHSRRCPDCASLLTDARPAIDPSLLDGVNAGPEACPRCRCPWPLLPPPAEAASTSPTTLRRASHAPGLEAPATYSQP